MSLPSVRTVHRLLLLLLLAGVAGSRLYTREQFVTGLDPASYLLGMQDFSIAAERPHPPGYPVYIALCRAVAAIVGDDHLAIIVVQVLFSVLAVLFLYMLIERKIGEPHALLGAIFLAVNPLFWLYGSTSENYAFDAMIAPLALLLVLYTRKWWWVGSGLLFGLAMGMRGFSVLLLAPVLLYVLVSRYRRGELDRFDLLRLGGGFFLGIIAWLPATIANEGGPGGYLHAVSQISMTAAGNVSGNLTGFVITLLWMLNLSAIYLIGSSIRLVRTFRDGWRRAFRLSKIILLWILPPLLFFAFVIQTKGYMLLILPGISLLLAWCLLRERSLLSKVLDSTLVVVAHLAFFILVPYLEPPQFTALAPRQRTQEQRALTVMGRAFSQYLPSYSRIRTLDHDVDLALRSMRYAIARGADSTLVVVDPSARLFVPARIYQYYLPGASFAETSIRRDSTVVFYHGIARSERRVPDSLFTAPRMLLVTDRRLVDRYESIDVRAVVGSTMIAILEVKKGREVSVRRKMEEMFVR